MQKIKRKRLVHVWDERLINSNKNYTGFIICSHFRNKTSNPNKLLINMSDIYLSNNKFPVIDKKIDDTNVYVEIDKEFKITSNNIKHLSKIYSIPNLTIYIIVLKNKAITYNKDFIWRRFIDLYKKNGSEDLYENILSVTGNFHVNIKLIPYNGLCAYFKIKQLYKYLIGYCIID